MRVSEYNEKPLTHVDNVLATFSKGYTYSEIAYLYGIERVGTREGSQVEVSKIILIWNGNSIPSDFLLVNLDFPAKKRRQNSNLLIRNPMEWNFHPR